MRSLGVVPILFAALTSPGAAPPRPEVAEKVHFEAENGAEDTSAALAFDGDESTVFRGAKGAARWSVTRRFDEPFHVGAVRVRFGDGSMDAAPAVFRWLGQKPVAGRCVDWAAFDELPDGVRTDRDGNEFLYGPSGVHAERQAIFPDETLCALRLRVDESDGGPPAIHEIAITESARAITRDPGVLVVDDGDGGVVGGSTPSAILDGRYDTMWSGAKGKTEWHLTVRLPEARIVDRLHLVLGLDAITTARIDAPGRSYGGAYLPRDYVIEATSDDDLTHLTPLDEANPPRGDGGVLLPVRRRLVRFSPRKVRLLRLTVFGATGPWGESDPSIAAPVVRDLELYAADDARPVIAAPSFLVVDANPPGLAAKQPGGASSADGTHGRDVHHRLRRVVAGVDDDTRWPADASRPRTRGTGRFVEVIEAGDPTLSEPFLRASFPPPITFLSGSFNWEYGEVSAPLPDSPQKKPRWTWDPESDDGGLGRLTAAVHERATPFIGFCGGAQILALLDARGVALERGATPSRALDAELVRDTLVRNGNSFIDGPNPQPEPYERAFWYDGPKLDVSRPTIDFDPGDPLFDTLPATDSARTWSIELPSMHSDMVRLSAFDNLLGDFEVVATSQFCRSWVSGAGPEESYPDRDGERCVTVPQAFRSHDGRGYPIVGFQFHPEQRDLQRLASGMPADARGDALNAFANAVDIAIASVITTGERR